MSDARAESVRFCLVRVDDRLLHGQVVLNWVRKLRPRRIAIVDDVAATDPYARSVLEMAAPVGIALWIGTVAQAAESLREDSIASPDSTLVLLCDPTTARALYEAGVHYAALNIGCLAKTPQRSRVRPGVHLSPDETEALRYLASNGVAVSVRVLPSERATSLDVATRRMLRHRQRRGSA